MNLPLGEHRHILILLILILIMIFVLGIQLRRNAAIKRLEYEERLLKQALEKKKQEKEAEKDNNI